MKGCAEWLCPFWSGYMYNINHMICKEAEALPLVWSAQSHKSWQSRRDFFPLSWVVSSWERLFFWPFLLVRVARPVVARCAGGPVSCWHYRFIEDTFHSAPDHGLDGRPSVLEGKTIWCLHRHNQPTQHVNGRTFQNKYLNRTPVYILIIRIESDPESQNFWVFKYL